LLGWEKKVAVEQWSAAPQNQSVPWQRDSEGAAHNEHQRWVPATGNVEKADYARRVDHLGDTETEAKQSPDQKRRD
jgi:hypothetical protein